MSCFAALGVAALGIFAIGRARRYHHHHEHACGGEHGHHHRRFGRGSHRGFGRPGFGKLRLALHRLNATPAQEQVIRHEWKTLRRAMEDARDNVRGTRGELGQLVGSETLDLAALEAVLAHGDASFANVRSAFANAVTKIHAVLDDQQRAMLAKWMGASHAAPTDGPYR